MKGDGVVMMLYLQDDMWYTFLYKQLFYKQHKAEIDKKLSKS